MTQSTPELLPVIQADRDAATDWSLSVGVPRAGWKRGEADDNALVQMFAAHRLQHSTPDRNAVLEEAAKVMENLAFFTPVDELVGMTKQEMSVRTCHAGAEAIRALMTTTPEPTDPAGVSEMAEKLPAIYVELEGGAGALVRWSDKPFLGGTEYRLALRTPDPVLGVAKEALEAELAEAYWLINQVGQEAVTRRGADYARALVVFRRARTAPQTINERSNHD